jgi:hypothetical protein
MKETGVLSPFSIGRRQPQLFYQRVVAAVGMDEVKDRFSLYQDEPRGTLVVCKIEEFQCRVLVAEVRVLSGKVVRCKILFAGAGCGGYC